MRDVRMEHLRQLIESHGAVDVDTAAGVLGVSRETIRRDMGELAERGLIRRTRGGASAIDFSLTEHELELRQSSNIEEKVAIARYVVDRLVEDGMSIALDGGTTALEVARQLGGRRNVTVVTANIPVVVELARARINVVIVGGELRTRSMTASGPFANDMMQRFHTDIALVSGPAINASEGLMDSYVDGVTFKKIMIDNANATYALLDSSKIGQKSFISVCGLGDLLGIVTDSHVSSQQLAEFEGADVDILLAEV